MKVANQNKIDSFVFSKENAQKAKAYLQRYPKDRQESAVIPYLRLAQDQCGGWLPQPAIEYVAQELAMPVIKVMEVASFYTMFNLKPVGEHLIQICRTTPCWLRGAGDLTKACKKHLGVGLREVTSDGKFSMMEVECLGACANAPMVQINDDYYEDLTEESLISILQDLHKGKTVKPGSQTGRQGSAPQEETVKVKKRKGRT